MQTMTWKEHAALAARQLLVAVVTAGIILMVLVIGFSGQTNAERQLQQETLYANLAQACVLSLPVDESGRDREDVKQCFTQYDIQPPSLVHP